MQIDQQTPAWYRERYNHLRDRALQEERASRPVYTPIDMTEDAVRHRETVPGGWYWSTVVPRGQALRIINTSGNNGVSVMLWNADDPSERYNAGDTVKLQWTTRLSTGRVLFSDMGRVLASIIGDTGGYNDALAGGSTPQSNEKNFGNAALRNTRNNMRLMAGKHGMTVRDVPPCMNFFSHVSAGPDGRLAWVDDSIRAGAHVDLRAEMNLLVGISNCYHPLSPDTTFAPEPIEIVRWQAPAPAADDLCRTFCEEARRGFENTDPLFR
ncbi:urea amidolyase associated protein UAAP1 [Komagataeibacter sp. FNDCR2]|uniref:urea amidolyase associated protein UAAP1 n=1 Tax=Komagataeibacter sp. FNDCR2 TaxID=2878682 RepID=UPI001E4DB6DE|nr:urea amidolyase associated protein UAAP1 [Komagataeibacter sp. FNDCR2]MCE2576147.1 urea carboxylase-associated family protein [Komagataeibacter sp. FNDCR2]